MWSSPHEPVRTESWCDGVRIDDKQPRFQQAWFLGVITAGGEGTALHPDGTQRHNGKWRESPLDDPRADTRNCNWH